MEPAVASDVWTWDDCLVAWRRLDAPVDEAGLTAAERGLVDSAPSPHRARELAAGRLAAKAALRAADRGFSSRSTLVDAEGRPRLEPPGDDAISLAHDGAYAVAAYSTGRVGVDLVDLGRAERVANVVHLRIEKGLAKPLDLGAVDASALPAPLPCLLWATWEAAGKRSGGGVLSGPMLQQWTVGFDADERWFARSGDVRVRWSLFEGHLLAVATAAT